jgi:hypothetical protein
MKRIAAIASFLSLVPCLILISLTGCSTWERATFQTLATAQATLNAAQAAYEVSASAPCPANGTVACLPHTTAVYDTITKAKTADVLAVNSMVTYEEAKAASAGTTGLAAAEADVNVAVGNLTTLIGDVKALGGSN